MPQPLHIALVTETFPPEINGVAMTLQRLSTVLVRRDYRVDIIRPRQHRTDDDQDGANPRIYTVPSGPLPGSPPMHFGWPAHRICEALWRYDPPDLVHIATEGPLGWSALNTATLLELPVISTFHTNFDQYSAHYGFPGFNQLVAWWLRHVHNRTGATLAPSHDICDHLRATGYHNVGLFSRGVDTDLFTPERRDMTLRNAWGADDETPVAIYVGRIALEKNLKLMIAAWEAMRTILPTLKLVLVGDGPARASLAKAHPEIIFAGLQRGEELARHYASADCFLFASTTETFGNVITEAMASGLPVLAYDYAAAALYLRHGENGCKAPFGDEAAFLAAARALAANHADWPQLAKDARATARTLSWDRVVDAYLATAHAIAGKL